jgi:aminopeptidase N
MRRWYAVAVLGLAASAAAQTTQVRYDYSIRLDPAARELRGSGVVTTTDRGAVTLALNARFQLARLIVDGTAVTTPPERRNGRQVWRVPAAERNRRIEVEWRGTLAPLDASVSHRDTLEIVEPVADPRGSFLPSVARWHPEIEGKLATYQVTLDLPADQKALVPGRLVEEKESDGRYQARFDFPYPAAALDLMAGPYRIESRDVRSARGKALKLRTYFHPEIVNLAADYLDAVKRYIDLYEGWIGEYPFTEFSVVSSPTPTGFGMPSLTYLGTDVLRLPFIRGTSLGHEVLHSWWGNGVYPDYARGNWSEGLTTFMADYTYKERESPEAARTMRLDWLRNLTAVAPGADRPLAEFTARTHGTSQIVGYDKGAMLFFMLRDRIGNDAFDQGLQRFWREQRYRVASWNELRRAFETKATGDLAPFFQQWLARSGGPAVRLASAETARAGDRYGVRLVLEQDAPAWRVQVPLFVRTVRGQFTTSVELSSERATFTIEADARPTSIALDPDFRLFRRLAATEAPPILRQVMIDPAVALLVPSGRLTENAATLAKRMLDRAPQSHRPDGPLPTGSLMVVGLHDEIDVWLAKAQLPGRPAPVTGRGSAQVWTAARTEGGALAVISARDAEALRALERPLPHYGRQSWLVFDGAKVLDRGVWPAQPQTVELK